MQQFVWMEVTRDRYELPVRIADTSEELADMCGVKADSIRSIVSRSKKLGYKWCKYIKVPVE